MDSAKPSFLGSLITRIACTVIGLLVLYAASVGPYCYLYERIGVVGHGIDSVYVPLHWLAECSTTTNDLLRHYENWFDDLGARHRTEAKKTRSEQP